MRRSAQVLLVLMGGGMVSAAAIPLLRQPECDPAVVRDGSCPTTTTTSYSRSSSGSGFSRSTGSGSGTDAGTSNVARGGFGATGAARAASSGS